MMILLGLLLLIGVPILTTLLMRMYWRVAGKKDESKPHFYKDIIPLLSIIIFSTIALLLLFYLLSILLEGAFGSFE